MNQIAQGITAPRSSRMSLANRKAIILLMIAEHGRITWSDLDPTQLTIQRWQEPMRQLLAERKVFKCKPRRTAIRRVYYEINPALKDSVHV